MFEALFSSFLNQLYHGINVLRMTKRQFCFYQKKKIDFLDQLFVQIDLA